MSGQGRFWLITAAALLGVLATLSLGRWQLSRAAQKESLQAVMEAQGRRAPLDGPALLAMPDPLQAVQRLVRLQGTWITGKTIFLDNRQMNAKPGFYVVTPLRLEGSDAVVLVQRGWVQRNFVDRARLPAVNTPPGRVEILGRIAPPPSKLYELGGPEGGPIRQNLDVAQFRNETGLPLMAVSVQQTDAGADELQRDWPVAGTGIEKHYGYAFQWFGLSGLITVLYVWFQIVRKLLPSR